MDLYELKKKKMYENLSKEQDSVLFGTPINNEIMKKLSL